MNEWTWERGNSSYVVEGKVKPYFLDRKKAFWLYISNGLGDELH